jgi:chorismate mutase
MHTSIKLIQLRTEIESLTKELLKMIEARNSLARQIGMEKRKLSRPLKDKVREERLLQRLKASTCLPEETVEELYATLAKVSLETQA